jgi:hypothetical protein
MASDQSSVDRSTIEQTKQQIRGLVNEIAQLCKSDLAPEVFYSEYLQRVVQALAAVGGAVWVAGEGGQLKLMYQIKLSETLLDRGSEESQRHARLLHHVMRTGDAKLVPPESGAVEDDSIGNPTRYLLVLSALRSGDQIEGVVEIFQRPESQPATQRGYLTFVMQMCDLAAEWIKSQKLRHFTDRQSLWAQADHFSRTVHESLDKRLTAYHIANEGRRLIGCDRVSVALRKGRKFVVQAVSGQDLLDARSNIVVALGNLATRVVATGEPLWYTGSTEDLPPQVEEMLHDYVEESFSKTIFVLPIKKPSIEVTQADGRPVTDVPGQVHDTGEIIGALIVEQIESNVPREVLQPRIDLVHEHSCRALSNSLEHSDLFLMPVWRTLGRASWVLRARTLPKTLAIVGTILVLLIAMAVVPWNFNLKAKGTLQPVETREVFVGVDGLIRNVLVTHGMHVKAGDVLLELENNDLELQYQDVLGRKNETSQQLLTVQKLRLNTDNKLTPDDRNRLNGEFLLYQTRLASLDRQLELLKQKRENLTVRSPIDGQVITWDVDKELYLRPVKVGELAMTVANPESDWELVLLMPDKRMIHFNRAQEEFGADLPVSYILATDPNTRHYGKVKEVDRRAELDQEEGHSVKVRADIKMDNLADPRPGATVIADVYCGRRPIGYVWFYQAYEAFQRFTFSLF